MTNGYNEDKPKKTRHISILDFLNVLEREFVCFDIRSKIYSSISDKTDYKSKADHKKKKIEDISRKNGLPTIFEDYDKQLNVRMEILGVMGVPNFIYRDSSAKKKFFRKDLESYFAEGSDVKFFKSENDDFFELGKIISYDFEKESVSVKGESGDSLTISESLIRRIL